MFMESHFIIPLSKSGEECKRKVCETFPSLEREGNDDNSLSSLAVSP